MSFHTKIAKISRSERRKINSNDEYEPVLPVKVHPTIITVYDGTPTDIPTKGMIFIRDVQGNFTFYDKTAFYRYNKELNAYIMHLNS
jgi:hypothetical protein